jgi:hypothetical protein
LNYESFLPLLLGLNGAATVALSQNPARSPRLGSLSTPHVSHTATLLPNGKVLVAGGSVISSSAPPVFSNAEHHDPSTGTFSPTGDMATARSAPGLGGMFEDARHPLSAGSVEAASEHVLLLLPQLRLAVGSEVTVLENWDRC